MKLYLAVQTTSTLMEGDYEQVLGVFSSAEKAKQSLSIEDAEETSYGWRKIFDGELAFYYRVEEVTIDKPRGEE